MKLKSCLFLVVLLEVFLVSNNANALLIVDTGLPNTTGAGWGVSSRQWLAGEFSTSKDYVINEITGWMWDDTGTGTIALYTDGGESPGTELFSTGFAAPSTNNWAGASGLGWYLAAGTYWVSFEGRLGDTIDTAMGLHSPNPLINEAFYQPDSGWAEVDYIDLGIRIDAAPVPEPATMLLLGTGLVGVAGAARRKKKNQA